MGVGEFVRRWIFRHLRATVFDGHLDGLENYLTKNETQRRRDAEKEKKKTKNNFCLLFSNSLRPLRLCVENLFRKT